MADFLCCHSGLDLAFELADNPSTAVGGAGLHLAGPPVRCEMLPATTGSRVSSLGWRNLKTLQPLSDSRFLEDFLRETGQLKARRGLCKDADVNAQIRFETKEPPPFRVEVDPVCSGEPVAARTGEQDKKAELDQEGDALERQPVPQRKRSRSDLEDTPTEASMEADASIASPRHSSVADAGSTGDAEILLDHDLQAVYYLAEEDALESLEEGIRPNDKASVWYIVQE
ncbi:unnamed protein product [Polarella glacialis]|uniref:Uncharacterized protein n=1 Tax=Polarella glacialis TaxID=89957 RepID=A0A813FIW8_POLGL|nr:unnamed protein product [Polarella glacialis]